MAGALPHSQRFSGVAKVSFGIYLVHVFFLMLLRNFGITALSFPPVLSVPVLTAAVFLASPGGGVAPLPRCRSWASI